MKVGDKYIVKNNDNSDFYVNEIVEVIRKDSNFILFKNKDGLQQRLFNYQVKPYERFPVSDCIENTN